MRLALCLLLIATFLVSSNATFLSKKNLGKVHSFDLSHRSNRQLDRRDNNDVEVDVIHNLHGQYYTLDVEVGSNKDKVTLLFDTGSLVCHVFDKNIMCDNDCQAQGTFDSSKSTSIIRTDQNITTWYGLDGGRNMMGGDLVYDDFTIGGLTVKNYSFVDDNYANNWPHGIMGFGQSEPKDMNVVWAAYDRGLIGKPAYSFILGDYYNLGKIHLGGYDKAKLDGEFSWHSINGTNIVGHTDYIIIGNQNITINKNYTIDSGGDVSYFPDPAYTEIKNAIYDVAPELSEDRKNNNLVKCSLLEGKSIKYSINGKEVTIPLKSLIWADWEVDGYCHLTINKGDYAQMGAYLFRYIHFVVDFENQVVGVGQYKNTTETDIVPL